MGLSRSDQELLVPNIRGPAFHVLRFRRMGLWAASRPLSPG